MLSNKKEEMVEGVIYCAKCDKPVQKVVLSRYEYVQGYPLHNVGAYRCQECGETFFTEEQAKQLERLTDEVRMARFAFERKVTVSGRSLVVSIPQEIAHDMRLHQGQRMKLYPVGRSEILMKKLSNHGSKKSK